MRSRCLLFKGGLAATDECADHDGTLVWLVWNANFDDRDIKVELDKSEGGNGWSCSTYARTVPIAEWTG